MAQLPTSQSLWVRSGPLAAKLGQVLEALSANRQAANGTDVLSDIVPFVIWIQQIYWQYSQVLSPKEPSLPALPLRNFVGSLLELCPQVSTGIQGNRYPWTRQVNLQETEPPHSERMVNAILEMCASVNMQAYPIPPHLQGRPLPSVLLTAGPGAVGWGGFVPGTAAVMLPSNAEVQAGSQALPLHPAELGGMPSIVPPPHAVMAHPHSQASGLVESSVKVAGRGGLGMAAGKGHSRPGDTNGRPKEPKTDLTGNRVGGAANGGADATPVGGTGSSAGESTGDAEGEEDALAASTDPLLNIAKNLLQEYCQKNGKALPQYDIVERTGLPHAPRFQCKVTVWDRRVFQSAPCPSVKQGDKAAALLALQAIAGPFDPSNPPREDDPGSGPGLSEAGELNSLLRSIGQHAWANGAGGEGGGGAREVRPGDPLPCISESPSWPAMRVHILLSQHNDGGRRIDFKTRLQQICQKGGIGLPQYQTLTKQGPPHQCLYIVQVRLPAHLQSAQSSAPWKSLRDAGQDAARILLDRMLDLARAFGTELAQPWTAEAPPAAAPDGPPEPLPPGTEEGAEGEAEEAGEADGSEAGDDEAPLPEGQAPHLRGRPTIDVPFAVLETALVIAHSTTMDGKSMLHHLAQKYQLPLPVYALGAVVGPPHNKRFTVLVTLWCGIVVKSDPCKTKKKAHQSAAKLALQALIASQSHQLPSLGPPPAAPAAAPQQSPPPPL